LLRGGERRLERDLIAGEECGYNGWNFQFLR